MPRRARLVLANVPLHIIQRGNNRQACFFADEDYRFYLDWLTEYAGKTGCQVHAYVIFPPFDGHRVFERITPTPEVSDEQEAPEEVPQERRRSRPIYA